MTHAPGPPTSPPPLVQDARAARSPLLGSHVHPHDSSSPASATAPSTPSPVSDTPTPILYSSRFTMLLLFSLLSFTNAMQWITFAPAARLFAGRYFAVSDFAVNALSLVFMAMYLPFAFPAAAIIDGGMEQRFWACCASWDWRRRRVTRSHQPSQDGAPRAAYQRQQQQADGQAHGQHDGDGGSGATRTSLRTGLLYSAMLNFVGSVLRLMPWPFIDMTRTDVMRQEQHAHLAFALTMLGQTLSAVAQCFILATPPKVAQNWFPPHERVRATSTGTLLTQAGVAFSFFLTPTVLKNQASRVPLLMGVQVLLSLLPLLLIYFFFRSRPPTPPSLSAEAPRPPFVTIRVLRELVMLRVHSDYRILLVCFGVVVGSFYAFSTLLGQFADDLGYSEDTAGSFGSIMVVVGLLGAGLCGMAADKLSQYHRALTLGTIVGTAGSFLWIALVAKPDRTLMLGAACAVLGFFTTAILPVSLDLAVETTYGSAPETVSSTFLMLSAQVFGIIFITFLSTVHDVHDNVVDSTTYTLTGVTALAALLMLRFRGQYLRLNAESEASQSRAASSLALSSDEADDDDAHSLDLDLGLDSDDDDDDEDDEEEDDDDDDDDEL